MMMFNFSLFTKNFQENIYKKKVFEKEQNIRLSIFFMTYCLKLVKYFHFI
jgi:hypothetical protein